MAVLVMVVMMVLTTMVAVMLVVVVAMQLQPQESAEIRCRQVADWLLARLSVAKTRSVNKTECEAG